MPHYRLPLELRNEMRQIIGPIITSSELQSYVGGSLLIAVGDEVVRASLSCGLRPKVAIVDMKTRRGPAEYISLTGYRTVKVVNPPQEITSDLWNAIKDGILSDEHVAIIVEGEEDLASIPAILLAPLGSVVIYGLVETGIALIRVGPEEKKKVMAVLENFERMDEDKDRE